VGTSSGSTGGGAVRPLVTDVKFIEADRLGVFVARALEWTSSSTPRPRPRHRPRPRGAPVRNPAVGVPILTEKIDIASVRLSFEGDALRT